MTQEHLLKKVDITSLKSGDDTLDIDELKTDPDMTKTSTIDLKRLSNVVDKDVAKEQFMIN